MKKVILSIGAIMTFITFAIAYDTIQNMYDEPGGGGGGGSYTCYSQTKVMLRARVTKCCMTDGYCAELIDFTQSSNTTKSCSTRLNSCQ